MTTRYSGEAAETEAARTLRRAAALLRKRSSAATPGRWVRPLNTRYKDAVSGPLPEGETGTWPSGIDPATGQREHCTVAMVPTWSNGRHYRQRGGRDLDYIAALHPGVGTLIADQWDAAADVSDLDGHTLAATRACQTSYAAAVAYLNEQTAQ